MKLTDEYFFLERADSRDNLILQNKEPYLVGKIWMFRTNEELQAYIGAYAVAKVPGYRILISSFTSLRPCEDSPPVQTAINGMAAFYYAIRIADNEGRYNRYKEIE